MNYYDSISNVYGWLEKTPVKSAVLENAKKAGRVWILNNSNNRAIVIDTDTETYLQSYDTLILRYNKAAGTIEKLWKDYSKTTLKHVNDFIAAYGLPAFNKAGWTNFTMINTKGGVNA